VWFPAPGLSRVAPAPENQSVGLPEPPNTNQALTEPRDPRGPGHDRFDVPGPRFERRLHLLNVGVVVLLRQGQAGRAGAQGDNDYDVIGTDGIVIGRIFKATTSPAGTPWMWTLAYGDHEERTLTHRYETTRQAAMQAFARSWYRETCPTCIAVVKAQSSNNQPVLFCRAQARRPFFFFRLRSRFGMSLYLSL
jgi:hypothetical protein